jgi:hypothetical protein
VDGWTDGQALERIIQHQRANEHPCSLPGHFTIVLEKDLHSKGRSVPQNDNKMDNAVAKNAPLWTFQILKHHITREHLLIHSLIHKFCRNNHGLPRSWGWNVKTNVPDWPSCEEWSLLQQLSLLSCYIIEL